MARNLLALSLARAVTLALQLVAFGTLAARVGPSGIGVYAFAVAAVAIVQTVPNFGFRPVVARDVAQRPEEEARLVPALLHMRLVLGVVAYALLVGGVHLLGYPTAERQAVVVAGLLLFVLSLESLRIVLEVRLRVAWMAAADVAEAVAVLAGTILLVHDARDIVPFLWLYVAANAASGLAVAAVALRLARLDWRPRPRSWVTIARTGLPLGLAGFVIGLYYRLDIWILARIKPAADVGQYGAAYRMLDAFGAVPALLTTAIGPVLAGSVVSSPTVFLRRTRRLLRLVILFAVAIAVAGAGTAWRILPALPGFSRYHGGGVALAILAPAAALILLGTIIQGILISAHQQKRLLRISAYGLLVNIALNIALIPRYSYIGAAAATTATEVVLVVLSARELRRSVGVQWPRDRWPRVLVAIAAMGVAVAFTMSLNPFLQLVLVLAVYGVALPLTGAIVRDDLGGLLRRPGPSDLVEGAIP